MSLNLIKLCVGIEDVAHLTEVQALRLRQARKRGDPAVLRHVTRQTPKRADELLAGGSLYWVIRGFVRVRQALVGIEEAINAQGRPACALLLDDALVRTQVRTHRAFQGWRYLRGEDAPLDAAQGSLDVDGLPGDMADEFRTLGLL